jgi:hypothetical protein
MSADARPIRPLQEMGAAFRALATAPFLALMLLDILLAVVTLSIANLTNDSTQYAYLSFPSTLFFAATSIYLQIAVTLAAAAGGGDRHGADPWIKAALRHRCFWRVVGASLLMALAVMVGALLLIVGAVIVGSRLALSQAAVVLERKPVGEALQRSTELTQPARVPVGVMFTVLWLVPFAVSVIDVTGVHLPSSVEVAITVAGNVTWVMWTIAITRVFVKLGGAPAPPLQTLLYKASVS